MKVLYILHSTAMGGATISFINMISGLKEKGVDIYIIVPRKDMDFCKRFQGIASEIIVVPIAVSALQRAEREFDNKCLAFFINCARLFLIIVRKLRSLLYLIIVVRRVKPDIIHTNTGVIHEGFRISELFSIPHVWHLREFQDKDFHWQILPSKKIFISYLKQSYVISITNEVHNSFGLNTNDRFRVIYNGIYPYSSCCLEMPKKKYFLCASRVSPEKGIKDVINCFSIFHKQNSEYNLVILGMGNPDYISELKMLVNELQCEEVISFIGHVDDVTPFMKRASALVVASYQEGFGRMTAEACFLGTIVIGRDTGGTKEILDYTGGLKFNSNEELVEMMYVVSRMTDSEYKQRVLCSQKKAEILYSIENNVNQVYSLYNYILK